jgi:hypothetical protein
VIFFLVERGRTDLIASFLKKNFELMPRGLKRERQGDGFAEVSDGGNVMTVGKMMNLHSGHHPNAAKNMGDGWNVDACRCCGKGNEL